MTENIVWPILFVLVLTTSCAAPRSSGGRAEIGGNAQVESVDTSSTQTERGTSVQDAQITGDVVTSNADLGKGWGGLASVVVLLGIGAVLIAVGLPAPPAPWGLYSILGGGGFVAFGLAMIWKIYT